jgi:hypothetical protein
MTALTFYESNALRHYPMHQSWAENNSHDLHPSIIVDANFILYGSGTAADPAPILEHPNIRISDMHYTSSDTVLSIRISLTGNTKDID